MDKRIRHALQLMGCLALAACGGGGGGEGSVDLSPGRQDITYRIQVGAPATVTQGNTATLSLSLGDVDSEGTADDPAEAQPFTAPVDLRLVDPRPHGLDGDFAPGTLRPGDAGTLTVRAARDAQPGRFHLSIAATLSGGSSTTRWFPADVDVIGDCSPVAGNAARLQPSAGNRTVALGWNGEVFVWGPNGAAPGTGVPTVYGFYTPQRAATLSSRAVSAASIGTTTVIVPDADGLHRLTDYWHSDVGSPGGRAGWFIEAVPNTAGDRYWQVVATDSFFVVLKSDRTVWRLEPVRGELTQIAGFADVIEVAAGSAHVIGLRSDGTLLAWGANAHGQLGDGTKDDHDVAIPVAGVTGVQHIAAGAEHSLAVRDTTTVLAWGRASEGQIGNGITSTDALRPTEVLNENGSAISGIRAVAAGAQHSLASASGDSVWSWGRGTEGQLGTGVVDARPFAQVITGLRTVRIAAGGNSSFSLDSGSREDAHAWGSNEDGRLGDGTLAARSAPVRVLGLLATEARTDCRATATAPSTDIVFEDTQFVAADWDKMVTMAATGAAETAGQAATGGNPGSGPFRTMTHRLAAGPSLMQVAHLNRNAIYSPATQGAITSIDYREDRRLFAETADPARVVTSQLAVKQGDRIFRAAFAALNDVSEMQWTTASGTGVLAQNFLQVGGSACPEGQSCPDFGATGAPMTFGYWRASGSQSGAAAFELVHGIDNWRVTVHRQ